MVLLNVICVISMKKKQKYYSYSQLNTFNNCPQKYKIIYIDKIKSNNESIEAFVGKRVHETLDWLYSNLENNDFVSFDRIVDKFNDLWNQKWHDCIYVAKNPYKKVNVDYLNKNNYKKVAINNLSLFYNKYFDYSNDNNIFTEMNIEIKIEKFKFKGIIDRLDIGKDKINIIDYKTGKTKLKLTLMDKLQLFIYQLAIEEKYKNKEIYLNWLYVNNKNIQHEIVLNNSSKDKLKNKLLSLLKQIDKSIASNQFPWKESLLCNWCYYWSHCKGKKELNKKNSAINLK